jgi:hypothetical protein
VKAHALLPDGTGIITLDSGHLLCLKLYHGSRRVTFEEAGTSGNGEIQVIAAQRHKI